MENQISFEMLDRAGKINLLSRMTLDYLNISAVQSDETENYIEGRTETDFAIRIRTAARNVDAVYLRMYGMDFPENRIPMYIVNSTGFFDFFGVQIFTGGKAVRYCFELLKNGRSYYYNKQGLTAIWAGEYDFTLIPGFKAPEWARGAITYQIYVDRFSNGDPTNDVVNNEYAYLGHSAKRSLHWDSKVSEFDVCTFHGGDLLGVMKKLPYLKDLGVQVIYFTPIFVSPSNHKYDIQDYDYVDPHFGAIVEDDGKPLFFEKFNNRYATKYMARTTNKRNLEASNNLLAKLISLAHKNGIKVILDGVFNHCGAFNKWLDKENFYGSNGYPPGAYRDKNSPYNSYFRWYDRNWPGNDAYDSWWGHDNHPKLNYEQSPELYNYIMDIGRKWVSPPYNADGWRLDVAADLGYSPEMNHKFWRDFRKAVKEANPDAIITAEHYGDPSAWLAGDQWDTIMNYDAFMEPITWFLTGMEKHSEEFRPDLLGNAAAFEGAMRYNMARMSLYPLQTAMNELSNHDHSRFLTRTNMTVGRLHTNGAEAASTDIRKDIFMEAVVFQMTWPGAPTLYYGDEAGLTGWTDPDNRRPYPWGQEDSTLLNFHRKAIAIHREYSALNTGSLEFLLLDSGIISFGRFDSNGRIAVILNNNAEPMELAIPVWKIGITCSGVMKILLKTYGGSFFVEPEEYAVKNGRLHIEMPAYSSVVLGDSTISAF